MSINIIHYGQARAYVGKVRGAPLFIDDIDFASVEH